MLIIFVGQDSNPTIDVVGCKRRIGKPDLQGEILRNKFRSTDLVARNLFRDYTGCVVGYINPIYACVCNGGDSSPASDHGSPLKRTVLESVSTDLHALSRGFIPVEIMVTSGIETRLTGRYCAK